MVVSTPWLEVVQIIKFKTEIKIDSDCLHYTFSTDWTPAMNLNSVLQLGPNNSSEKRQISARR